MKNLKPNELISIHIYIIFTRKMVSKILFSRNGRFDYWNFYFAYCDSYFGC